MAEARMIDEARALPLLAEARARGWRVATAESCTGGLVSAALTEPAGASDVFEAGFITYANEAKLAMLGVSEDILSTFGAVSVAVAWAMAQGALKKSDADVAVAVVREFTGRVRERALGDEVSKALNPAQQVVKIVNEELVTILGGETRRLELAKTPPTVIMLAGLQGEAVGRVALGVDRHADQAARHRALVGVAAGQVGRMWAAVAHRHAETLGGAADDVGVPFAWRHEQRQRQQVGRHAQGGIVAVGEVGQRAQVVHLPGGGRVLRERAEEVARLHQLRQRLRRGADPELDAQRRRARAQHLDGLRMAVAGDQEDGALGLHAAARQGHGLGRGGGLVEHRDRKSGG